ncbi:MAG TPA: tetratricopeptide repeat protein [Ktedonobacteraceae bacterium]|jgi:tetratricopeptide (TPR) repeat protein/transcriptional regulator with XRE-family HTH domain|nr:tetratricopeptide repeat protein [Ktedonobacteraceae bacterium]
MQRNEQLRRQRIKRNWRQQDLADQLGVTVVTIQRWERGSQQPSAYYRIKLCTLFGLSSQELGLSDGFPSESATSDVAPERNDLSEQTPLWTVPYARNPHFTGRDDVLQQLGHLFAAKQPGEPMNIQQAVLTQTQAISGLGGIGKTQIAIEYAYRARMQGRYRHTIWISAANEETILTSFVELARLVMPTLVKDETNQRTIVTALLRWLEQCTQPWLLIFDNADDLDLVQPYLPHQGNGHMLLTTRASAVGALASSIEVDLMGILEGTYLLLRRARRFSAESPEMMDDAINLVIALAQFPLAIDQAGAYIEETGCTLRDYLQLYQTHRHALLARRGRQATGYPESVATTWSLSFKRVEEQNPAATEFLRICAFLAPDHIPEELLTKGAPQWPPTLRETVTNPLRFNEMLEALLAFSLVKRLAEDRMLSLHRLVQAVQIDHMEVEAQRTWSERVVRALETTFPADPKNVDSWPQCLRYLEQAQVCDALIQSHQLQLPEAADLLDRTGTYLHEHALYEQAESLYLHALSIREQHFGPDHPRAADSLSNLGVLYRDCGRYKEVEPLYLRVLAIREQQGDPDDLALADALNNLANIYESYRLPQKAEPLYLRALTIREHHLGPDHPQMAASLHGLGNLYWSQGRYEEAMPFYQRALAIREQHLGPDHLHTAATLNNIANIYYNQGRYEEAEPLYLRAHAIREQHFGSDHPHTAATLNNLGIFFTAQGRYKEAEPFHQRALAIREQHFGPDHPHTADSLGNLSILYHEWGKNAQAEALVLRALSIHEDHLGPEHPYTAEDLGTLASIYRDQGKEAEAESLFLRALKICEATLAPTDLQFSRTLHAFALLRQAQGRNHDAHALYKRALAARTHVLGVIHPLTIDTREHLEALLSDMGRAEEARQLEGTQPETMNPLRERTFTSSREGSTVVAHVTGDVLPACPQCQQTTAVLKSGKNRSGSLRFHCRVCRLYFTPQPGMRKPDQVRKAEALALAKQGISYRRIARQLGVHHQTVSAWISTPGTSGAE